MPPLKLTRRTKIFQRLAPFVPALLTLALILLGLLPRRFFIMAEVAPMLALGSIYYWTLFRPKLMPAWVVFLLALGADALMGLPLGLSSFLGVMFVLGVSSQRKTVTRQTFWTMWFAFSLFSAGYVLLYWILLSASYQMRLPVELAALQWALTAGCYPLLHLLCNRTYVAIGR